VEGNILLGLHLGLHKLGLNNLGLQVSLELSSHEGLLLLGLGIFLEGGRRLFLFVGRRW
jgi:hypothetical protein